MYSILIYFYATIVRMTALFHRKARLMCRGQRETESILREKIDPSARYIWFHAASLGEFEQGRPLMEQIRQCYPDYKILLTFFSPSGYEVRKNYKGADIVCYLPFDTPTGVYRFLDLARPVMAVFIKYEFWGNYLHELQCRGIPVYIISAVFRPSQLFFQWFGAPYRQMLHCFTHLFVQDKRSAELLARYGITNVTISGDTRFDQVLKIREEACPLPEMERFVEDGMGGYYPILVAGSSWPQDEEILIPYFNEKEDLKMIIAPHEIHEEHLVQIEEKLQRPTVRWTAVQQNPHLLQEADCLIIDCFGLLSSIYRYGKVAYIGGGFGAGIHNTVEAAVYDLPVLFGPRHGKFIEANELLAVQGAFEITDAESFEKIMCRLLTDEVFYQTCASNAGDYVRKKSGAVGQIMEQLAHVLK